MTENQIIDRARLLLTDYEIEHFLVIDNKTGRYLKFKGGIDTCSFNLKEITDFVENDVWVAHNHPANNLRFSLCDFSTTSKIRGRIEKVGYKLTGHILLTEKDFKVM